MKLRFGIIAGIVLAIFTLYPQMKMLYLRGDDWNGHYAYNDIDEVAYASYVRALIDGRPRKSDPYSGRDDSPENPQPESLFSIQFAAPYAIAVPARILGIETPWAMTLAGAIAGFMAALAVFWLMGSVVGDSWFAMAASLVVFCGGALAAGEGALAEILFDGFSYPYFPGFRRYIPALAFPAFFGMIGLVWMMLNSGQRSAVSDQQEADAEARTLVRAKLHHGEDEELNHEIPGKNQHSRSQNPKSKIQNPKWIYGILATLCFAFTVYSYFYVWTTAAAWLFCLTVVWLLERPEGFRRDIKALTTLGIAWAFVLLPYVYLLSQRSDTMDDVQLLVHTRMPDLFRFPEYISFAILILVIAGLAAKIIKIKDRPTLFALSLALATIVVFNQQIITGRSLQPIHYQVFIGNYVALLALMLTIGLLWRGRLHSAPTNLSKAACAAIAVVAIVWGFVECHYTVRVLDEANIIRDNALPVAGRLEELAKAEADPHRSTVLAYDVIQADDLPSIAPQNVLWARHQHVFAGLSWQENKERYFKYLYYSNVDAKGLDYLLKNDFVSKIALFGWGRHTDRLSSDSTPLTYGEIAGEVQMYSEYIAQFGADDAANPTISYVVLQNSGDADLSKLDKWYERDAGEIIGEYTLFKVRLR